MQKQIDKEKKDGLILDPMQIAQQAQTDMATGGDGGTGGAPTPPPKPKTNEGVQDDYSPSLKMISRVL
jgi:hypothetical protein